MDREERAFRERLRKSVLAKDWAAFLGTRLVFADWLDEHDRTAEAAMTRAAWELARSVTSGGATYLWHGEPWLFVFHAAVPNRPRWQVIRRFFGRTNAEWILGFSPRSLHFLSDDMPTTDPYLLRLTWIPGRVQNTTWVREDTDLHPLGVASLWLGPA